MLDEFIASVKTQGLMRSNRYTVQVGDVVGDPNLRQTMMYCSDVQIPGLNLSTAQTRMYGEFREAPYEKLYGDINLTFYVDNDLNVKNYFDRWMNLIQHPKTRAFNYYVNYIAQMIISVEDLNDNVRYDIQLYEVYPKSIGQIQMGYDQKDIMKLQVTMQYKYYEFISYTNDNTDPTYPIGQNGVSIPSQYPKKQEEPKKQEQQTSYSVGNPMGDVSGYGNNW